MNLLSNRVFFLGILCFAAILFSIFETNQKTLFADWPLVRGNRESTGTPDETVTIPKTLSTLWTFTLKKGWFQATPIIAAETVFVGSSDIGMHAINLHDGKELWSFPVESGILAPATYFRDANDSEYLFFADADGTFYAIDTKTGKERWQFKAKGTLDNGANIDIKTKRVLFGSESGSLYALNIHDGSLAWQFEINDQIRCFPSIFERFCFVAGCDAIFHVIDLDTGKEVRQIPIDAPTGSTPVITKNHAFFGTEGNEMLAVNWRTGEIFWRFEAKQAFRGPAALYQTILVCGGFDRSVYAIDSETGKEMWSYKTKARIEGGPVIVGNRVFIASNSMLYSFDIKNGEKQDSIELDGNVLGSPAVVSDRLVLSTDAGTVICFGEKNAAK
ncbi:MAG: PQQ-binding-like beta-propeller repeat protein [Thermoguttaceae bacterium]